MTTIAQFKTHTGSEYRLATWEGPLAPVMGLCLDKYDPALDGWECVLREAGFFTWPIVAGESFCVEGSDPGGRPHYRVRTSPVVSIGEVSSPMDAYLAVPA